jgi:hypothetical protein
MTLLPLNAIPIIMLRFNFPTKGREAAVVAGSIDWLACYWQFETGPLPASRTRACQMRGTCPRREPAVPLPLIYCKNLSTIYSPLDMMLDYSKGNSVQEFENT